MPTAEAPRRRPRSVRARVTLIATSCVLVVLVATSAALVAAQRHVLTGTLEEGIETKAADLVRLVAAGRASTPLAGFGDDDAVVQVVDGSGTVLASTTNLRGAGPIAPGPAAGRRWRTLAVAAIDEPRIRTLSVPATGPAGERLVIHVGATLGDVDESTSLLAASLAGAVPVVTAVLGLLVWVMVGRTLRPVEAIRAEVAAIGGSALHRRVPEPGSGDEIDRLAATMNDMLDRLQQAAVRQQRFVADASHELRSPLTRMRAELEVDRAHPATADLHATHASVLEEVVGLEHLVEDLLLLARADADPARPSATTVSLDVVVQQAIRRRDAGHPVVRTSELPPLRVRGAGDQLERAIGNVLENALRHARTTVECGLTATLAAAVVTISDDGPGVPPEHRERIFERFARVDAARGAASGGTGLGLAIARDIIERHGGAIRVVDGDGPGTTVAIQLPLA